MSFSAPGMYADLDFEALRSLEPLLLGEQLVLAAMTADLDWHQSIPNAWMASARRHPFWLFTLAAIIRAAGANDTERRAHAALPVCWSERFLCLRTRRDLETAW